MRTSSAARFARELEDTVNALRRVTVQVRTRRAGIGAGVVWDARGLVVTNAHVVHGDQVTVELEDGRAVPATLIGRDRRRDLAALLLGEPTGLASAVRRDPLSLQAGELAIAVGHPGGQVGAAALGVIHAAHPGAAERRPSWIRADVRLAPGFSGGPLGDAAGRVLGINTLIQRGLAFAVPASVIERWVRGVWSPAGPARREAEGVMAR